MTDDKRARAEAEFWARVEQFGGRPAPGAVYAGSAVPVALLCPQGHPCSPRPNNVRRRFPCRVCAGLDPVAAEAAFWARVAELGARPAPGARYAGAQTRVALICVAGHPCSSRPNDVRSGDGICKVCAGLDPVTAAASFWARVAELGAEPAPGAAYRDNKTPVAVVCAAGHTCSPRPNAVLGGQGLCRICARKDRDTAAAAFWARVAELGGRPAPGARYVTCGTPVPLICPAGHRASPAPTAVQQGQGICEQCVVSHDRVYLLEHTRARAVKVGVASGPGRVAKHRGRGYRLVAQWTGLDHVVAADAERTLIRSWRDRGLGPVLAVPVDGRTETAPIGERAGALAFLTGLLGPADPAEAIDAAAELPAA